MIEPEERRRYVDALEARQRGEREPFRSLMMEKLNAALDRHVEALQRRIAVEQALGVEGGAKSGHLAATDQGLQTLILGCTVHDAFR